MPNLHESSNRGNFQKKLQKCKNGAANCSLRSKRRREKGRSFTSFFFFYPLLLEKVKTKAASSVKGIRTYGIWYIGISVRWWKITGEKEEKGAEAMLGVV